jgi:hypothetical protein
MSSAHQGSTAPLMRRVWCEGGGAGVGVLEGRVGSLGGVGVLGVLGEDSRQRDLSAVVIMEPRSGGRGFLEPNIGFLSVAALVIMEIGGGADRDRGEGEVT